jgi:FkbM family methyltransferase
MKILLKYIDKHGVKGLVAYIKMKIGMTRAIKMPNILYPIALRSRTSDLPTFDQVFLGLEYNIDFTFQIERVIDAGGNIGLAAIYFANKYPNAKITSVEPEKDNFKMCVKNTKNYNNITPVQKALSNSNGEELYIKDSGLGSWAFTTVSKREGIPESNKVLTINIEEILNQNNWDIVDIVKIDIEGAEKELFDSNFERWIPRTKCIIIELHDRMKKGCSKSFFKTISQYNFSCELRGENLILINLEF